MGTSKIENVAVYLTSAQIHYLAQDPEYTGDGRRLVVDTVITKVDGVGGIFVEQASTAGEDGSGVWVDAKGREHQDSAVDFAMSNEAHTFYQEAEARRVRSELPAHSS